MLDDFFECLKREEGYCNFATFEISSIEELDGFTEFLGHKIIESYKDVEFLRRHFAHEGKEALKEYLQSHVYPEGDYQIDQNVKNGDLGEIIGEQTIHEYEEGLTVPIKKLKWKMNNKKSVFCTDIFAHNSIGPIDVLKYYEVKTYTTRNINVGVKAFDALKKDVESGREPIANFLSQRHLAKAILAEELGQGEVAAEHYEKSDEYMSIVKGSKDYTRKYEAILVREKGRFREEELERIDEKEPFFDDLLVSVVLVDNLQDVINLSFEKSYDIAWDLIKPDE